MNPRLIPTLALALLSGCAAHSVDKVNADGSHTHVSGISLFTDKGIQEANVEGIGSIRGYQSNVNADAVRAAVEGAVGAAVKAAKP